jgi:hypothetical protein
MRAVGLFERLSAMGAGAQASVPGVYAWGVTVAPVAWARGASTPAKVAAVTALLALGVGVMSERHWSGRARAAGFWGFVVAATAAWSLAPPGLGAPRIDALHGLAGVFGWGLFAYAAAAPALPSAPDGGLALVDAPTTVARQMSRGDTLYIVGGAFVAAVQQGIGWRVANGERSLLVRFVALAAGLATISAATQLALARRLPRAPQPPPAGRLRRAFFTLVALGMLAFARVIFTMLD